MNNAQNGGAFVRFINRIADAVLGFLHLSRFKEQIMYIIVGWLTTVVDWAVFAALDLLLPDLSGYLFFDRFPNAIEYTAAWAAAVLFAFWASRHFVFENAKNEGSVQFFKFVGSRLITLGFSLAGDFILTGLLEMNQYLAKLIISVFVVVLNYITSKLLVFNKKSDGGENPQ